MTVKIQSPIPKSSLRTSKARTHQNASICTVACRTPSPPPRPVVIRAPVHGGEPWETNEGRTRMTLRKLGLPLGVVLVIAVVISSAASAARGTATVQPQVISDANLKALTTTIGDGANPLPTTRTVPHWWGSTLDPNNGVTYG